MLLDCAPFINRDQELKKQFDTLKEKSGELVDRILRFYMFDVRKPLTYLTVAIC